MRTFAILHEPASYTVNRNHRVYHPLGIHYNYMYGQSEALSGEQVSERPLHELSLWQLARRLREILREHETIIVNGYAHRVFVVLFLLNYFYGRTIGIDSDTPLAIPSHWVKRMLKSMYLGFIFRNRHVCGLAGGTGEHKELFRHYGMKEERIFLMPMMVDNERFLGEPAAAHIPFTFLYVGRLVPCKNLDVLFRAFMKAFGSEPETAQLLVVGGGELEDALRKQYGACRNIHFLGRRFGNDLIASYRASDVLILPSSYEPWGLVVNEAMAAGLPVVVSDRVGAAHDLVQGRETGYIFPHDDAETLYRQMRDLHESPDRYIRYAQNAFQLMHGHWNYDLYTRCLRDFLTAASTSPSPRRSQEA